MTENENTLNQIIRLIESEHDPLEEGFVIAIAYNTILQGESLILCNKSLLYDRAQSSRYKNFTYTFIDNKYDKNKREAKARNLLYRYNQKLKLDQ